LKEPPAVIVTRYGGDTARSTWRSLGDEVEMYLRFITSIEEQYCDEKCMMPGATLFFFIGIEILVK
jgi:hypothetical protein